MANYSYLTINDKTIMEWKWSTPSSNESYFSFIFTPEDKFVEEITGREWFEILYDGKVKEKMIREADPEFLEHEELVIFYFNSVGKIKQRLEELGFTIEKIDDAITQILDIPRDFKYLHLISMDEDEFLYDELNRVNKDQQDELKKIYYELHEQKERNFLGFYPKLRKIKSALDDASEDSNLVLDLNEGIITEYDEITPIETVYEEYDLVPNYDEKKIRLERTHLEHAKAHFTTLDFDLVYIRLMIDLELAINRCLNDIYQDYVETSDTNITCDLRKMGQKLSLVDQLKFVLVFIGKQNVPRLLFESIEDAYDTRNTIIHQNQKNFEAKKVYQAIEAVEEVIDRLNDITI